MSGLTGLEHRRDLRIIEAARVLANHAARARGRGMFAMLYFVAGWSVLWAHGLQIISVPDWVGLSGICAGLISLRDLGH